MLYEIYTTICVLTFLCHTTNGSEVYDRTNDNTVYISNYCPTFKKCQEGTHILCSIYSPDRPNHEFCDNSYNVSFTPEMVNLTLTRINNMRSKIAKGLETGKDKVKLPRGYGIPRVQWDPELALFAQIDANRCTRRERMCIASLKFDEPYRFSWVTYFRDPNWTSYHAGNNINEKKGLTNDKLLYAITNHYEAMNKKELITPDVINNYQQKPGDFKTRYLAIINSKMTHVGCGIAIFKAIFEHERFSSKYLYHVYVICNFSSSPKNKIYNTTNPKGNEEYTKNCGCRLPNMEDEDCLCNIVQPNETKFCNEPQSIGDPQLIVLPIITVQNAPEDKLVANLKTYRKSISRRPTIPEHLIRNQFVPKEHKFEQVGYNKKDVVPRGDFVKIRKLTEIYTSNNKNRRYLSYKEPQVAYSNGDNGLFYSTRRDRFYNLTEKNGFNKQRKDFINEEFKFQILTLLNNLVKVTENARYKSDKKPLILKEIHNVFNMLVERNNRDKANERIDQHYSENLDYKSISRRPILDAEKISQRNTVREKADLGTRYFIRNKTIDIYNRYNNAHNGKIYEISNNRRDMHNNNQNRLKTIQSVKSDRQRRPLKQQIQKKIATLPKTHEKKHQFYIPDRSTRLLHT